MKIQVGTKVKAKVGGRANNIGEVTTIITTNRKRFYVTFEDGECTSYFFRHLTTKLS